MSTQHRILEACSDCIAENGVRGLRVTDVARQAGVSSGLLYYHFTDRDGLIAATLEYVNTEQLNRRHNESNRTTPFEDLRYTLLDEIIETPDVRAKSVVWNEIRAISVFDPVLARHFETITQMWMAKIIRLISAAHPAGQLTDNEIEQTALVLTTLVEGASGRWLSGQITAEQARATVDAGIAATMSSLERTAS